MTAPAPFAVRLDRDVFRVGGPDAVTFLQGQLSQDVEALAVGRSAFTLLLEPDGKLGFWLRISRTAPDELVLDIDQGSGEALAARLERFKLRIDASVEPLDWSCVGVRGTTAVESTALVAAFDWPGLTGVDLLGAGVAAPPDLPEIGAVDYESRRVAAGVPRMGAEITDGRTPAETGLVERSVSFTKGCYTGQELVARVDSRGGNAPRHLRRLTIDGRPAPGDTEGRPEPGDEVVVDGEVVGALTSVAPALDDGSGSVALAYVKRAVEVPADAVVGEEAARIEALPG